MPNEHSTNCWIFSLNMRWSRDLVLADWSCFELSLALQVQTVLQFYANAAFQNTFGDMINNNLPLVPPAANIWHCCAAAGTLTHIINGRQLGAVNQSVLLCFCFFFS